MKHKTKVWLLVAITLALLLAGLSYWKMAGNHQPTVPTFPPITVEVSQVQKRDLTRSITTAGTLIADQAVTIRPQIDGLIEKLYFTDGQAVTENEPLLHLRSTSQEAELMEAQAKLALSQVTYQRNETLLKTKSISTSDRDIAFSQFKVDEALAAKAQAELAKTTIKAPFFGQIGISKVDEGEFITSGQEVVDLVKLDPLGVDFKIPEIYLYEIKLNQSVEISSPALPQPIKGNIVAIDPQINPTAHSLYLRAEIPNTDLKLKPGLFVTVNLLLEQRNNVLFVPETALVPQEGKQFVYVVKNNQAILTEVSVGERQATQVEIKQGLQAGELVIIAGQNKIHPGSLVNPINISSENATAHTTESSP